MNSAGAKGIDRAIPILLVLLTWTALGGVVGNGFVNYDDDLYVTANAAVRGGLSWEALRWAFTTTLGGNWHPLTWVSHLLDVRLFGMNAGAHHAVSLAFHSASTVILFSLLRGITGARWPSALVAALFAIHPLHVESVAWAAERKDVLSTLLALGAALAYTRGVRRRVGGWTLAATALFALALLAKPMPLTLPLLLLVLDWWPLGRWSPVLPGRDAAVSAHLLPPAALWREKAPLLALCGVSAIVTVLVQSSSGAMQATAGIALPARAANAVVAYAGYLRKVIWPVDLAVFYPYPWAGHRPITVVLSGALLTALVLLALRQSRRRPWLAAGFLWYLIALLPVIGLLQVGEQAMADRYTYLPLVGIFGAVAWSLAEYSARGARQARAAALLSLLAVVVLGTLAARQVRVWHDGATLFSQATAVTSGNYIAENNLGTALLKQGNVAAALPHFEATIRLAPGSPKGYHNLGRALAQSDRHEEAVDRFRDAIARDASDPLAHRNLGLSLEGLGRRNEAIDAYREAVRLQPQDARTLDLLGVALARAGLAAEAVAILEEAAACDPTNPSIRDHLAVAKAQLGTRRTPADSGTLPGR